MPNGATARLGGASFRPGGMILGLAVSPDGRTIAAGDSGPAPWLWDAASGRKIRELAGDLQGLRAVAFSVDGTTVSALGANQSIMTWDAKTGERLSRFEVKPGRVHSSAFSPDGKTLALSLLNEEDGKTRHYAALWDVETGKQTTRFDGHSHGVHGVALAPDGKTAVSYGADRAIRFWDPATGKELRYIADLPVDVSGLAFAPDGKTLLTGGKRFRLWDAVGAKEVRSSDDLPSESLGLAFSPDGKTAAAATQNAGVVLWDATTGKERRRIQAEGSVAWAFAFSADGKTLLAGVEDRLRIWDVETGREAPGWGGHQTPVTGLAFTRDGKTLASAGAAGRFLRVWDLPAGKEVGVVVRPGGGPFALAPDGKTLAAADGADAVLWDPATGREVRRLAGHISGIVFMDYSADGRTLTTCSAGKDASLRRWDPSTGKELGRADGLPLQDFFGRARQSLGPRPVGPADGSFAFSTGAATVAALGQEGGFWLSGNATDVYVGGKQILRLWDAATGMERRRDDMVKEEASAVLLSADGKRVALLSGAAVRVHRLDAEKDKEPVRFKTPAPYRAPALSPDGRLLALAAPGEAGGKPTVRLYDLKTGKELAPLESGEEAVSLAFSADGFTLASGLNEGTILIWDLAERLKGVEK